MPKRARSPSPSPRNIKNEGISSTDPILPDTGARHQASAPDQSLQEEHERPLNGDGEKLLPGRKKGVSDLFPFQEIFLRILSFLSPSELAQVQRVSQYWARMSVDPQLWKRLYLSRYPHPHHSRLLYSNSSADQNGAWATPSSSSASSVAPRTPRSLRPIARLPSRAFPPPSPKRSPSIVDGVPTPTPDRTVLRPRAGIGAYAGLGHATPLQSRDVSNGTDGSGSGLAGIAGADASAGAQEEVGRGVRNDGVDWKLMLRLGTNWSNGNALSQSTITLPPSPSPSLSSSSTAIHPLSLPPSVTPAHHNNRLPDRDQGQGRTEQFIALSPSFIFISSSLSPLVQVHAASSHSSTSTSSASPKPLGIIPPPPGWSNPHRPDNVTAIVADQSVVIPDETDFGQAEGALPARIVVFYQSGGFVLLHISTQSGASSSGIKWKRESIHPPHTRPHSIKRRATAHQPLEGDPVVLAALHYPILISCTRDFHLSVYTFPPALPNAATASVIPAPRHLKTLHSEVSFHPAALSLFPAPTVNGGVGDLSTQSILKERDELDRFRAALTYCTPLYPSSWTVAVQELTISQRLGEVRRGDSYHVGRSGGDNCGDEDDDDTIVWPRKIRPIVGVKGKATGVGSDGRWCVLSGEGSQIQVYSLPHHPRVNNHHALDDDLAYNENELHATRYRKRRYLGDDEYTTQPIVHSQTLLAHSTEITSLALSAGRCVSGGRDGRVLVWELDEDVDEADGSSIDWKNSDAFEREGRMGRTVGYVEVKPGGRRSTWRGAAGPLPTSADGASDNSDFESESDDDQIAPISRTHRSVPRDKSASALPHPQSISSAARSLFLPRPPTDYVNSRPGTEYPDALGHEDEKPAIRHLVFDEEKIVGLVRTGMRGLPRHDTIAGPAATATATAARGSGVVGEDVMKVWNFSA